MNIIPKLILLSVLELRILTRGMWKSGEAMIAAHENPCPEISIGENGSLPFSSSPDRVDYLCIQL